jgi:ABC-2 type transport system ATP-binding protein
VIAAGLFVAEGTPATLAGRNTARPRLILPAAAGVEPPETLAWSSNGEGGFVLEPVDLAGALYELSSWAREARVSLEGLEIHRPSLEDVYLELTGGTVSQRPEVADTSKRRRGRHH